MTIGHTIVRRGGSALALCVLLLACRPTSSEWATSEPMLTSASLVPTDDAVDRIAGAACRRALNCGHIGENREFPDAKECVDSQRASLKNTVTPWGCPSGVIEHSLQRCVDRLMSEPCAMRLSTPAQLEECRRMPLCGTTSS